MEGMLGNALWEVFRWLPGFVFRRFFTVEWLQENVEIDIRPRHSAVSVCQPCNPSVTVYLVVRNNTHFDIEVDRIALKFFYGSEMADILHLRREELQPRETREIYMTASIEQSRADTLPFQYQHNSSYCRLQVLAECTSKLHNFKIETSLEGIRPEFLNEDMLRVAPDEPESS
jgi:hypothetical protein